MIGRTLGSYRIVEQVGMGGMATVYKAYDPNTERYVALKVLPEHYSQDPTFRRRFEREAKAIAGLEHIHILPVHAYGEEDGVTYLVMRYLPTGTLKARIAQGAMPLEEAGRLLGQVADALDYAHEHGILHRDVKPANVLIDDRGNAYLTDFGIAKMVEGAVDLTGTGLVGTPQYMSPEQCEGRKDLTPATDIYSLGIVLYETVTGRPPFEAETPIALIHMQLSDPLPPPRSLRADLPEEAEGVILKALSKKPEDRWPTCGAMAEAFEEALAGRADAWAPTQFAPPGLGYDEPAETIPIAPPVPARRLPMWALGAAGVLAVAGLVIAALALGVFKPGEEEMAATEPPPAEMPGGEPGEAAAVEEGAPAAPAPTSVSGPPEPVQGEILQQCGEDICICTVESECTPLGLAAKYRVYGAGSWSPDGSRIVFSACPAGTECRQDLFTANRDGSDVRVLLEGEDTPYMLPVWSPDGEWIALDHGVGALGIVRADGTASTILVNDTATTQPHGIAWSSDSRQIAWIGGNGPPNEETNDWVWIIDREGGDAVPLYHTPDPQLLPDYIAWSPDAQAIAVALEDGTSYLIDVHCQSGPDGCDASSRTEIDFFSFPSHWLHTYYPQWAGEQVAGRPPAAPEGPTTEEARAFAEPILDAIAGRPPDYEDDFSDPASGWTIGSSDDTYNVGEGGYVDGEYRTWAAPPDYAHNCFTGENTSAAPHFASFVLEVDARIVSGAVGGWGLHYHEWWGAADQRGFYDLALSLDRTLMFSRWQNETASTLYEMPNVPVYGDGSTPDHIQLITRGPEVALYVNGQPSFYVNDEGYSELYRGMIKLLACNHGNIPLEVRWDNLRIWDITDLVVEEEQTPIAAFAEPILNAITGRAPDYEDDFGDPTGGWTVDSGDEPYNSGKTGYVDGEYRIWTTPPTYDYNCYGGDNSGAVPRFDSFVLEVDARIVSGAKGDWQIQYHKWGDTADQHGYYSLDLTLSRTLRLRRWQNGMETTLYEMPNVPVRGDGSEPDHIQLITRGSEIAVYVNGRPGFYVNDEGYSDLYRGVTHLVACNNGNNPLEVRWDDLRIWDITDLAVEGEQPPLAAFADPILDAVAAVPSDFNVPGLVGD